MVGMRLRVEMNVNKFDAMKGMYMAYFILNILSDAVVMKPVGQFVTQDPLLQP